MGEKIAIVGNGFDISHGLKTGYSDFADTLDKKIKEDWERVLIENDVHPSTWYSFEEAIDKITANWQGEYFNTVVKMDERTEKILLNKINEINQIFSEMNGLLVEYLLEEDSKKIVLKETIKEVIDHNTKVINFNYTSTVEKYTKNIYYIHGSLAENEIVLGYKQRAEATGIMAEATEFDKNKLRESLNFRRYLISREIKDKELTKEIDDFKPHVKRMFSGRGGYVFEYPTLLEKEVQMSTDKYYEENEWISFNRFEKKKIVVLPEILGNKAKEKRLEQISSLINDYGETNNFSPSNIEMNINLDNVIELIILGHSLEADEELVSDIIQNLKKLETIKLFVYYGEDYSEKLNFLKNVSSKRIEILHY